MLTRRRIIGIILVDVLLVIPIIILCMSAEIFSKLFSYEIYIYIGAVVALNVLFDIGLNEKDEDSEYY